MVISFPLVFVDVINTLQFGDDVVIHCGKGVLFENMKPVGFLKLVMWEEVPIAFRRWDKGGFRK